MHLKNCAGCVLCGIDSEIFLFASVPLDSQSLDGVQVMRALLGAIALWTACVGAASAQELNSRLGEQVVMIPAGGFTESALEMTVFKPEGAGPFPVVLINHGRALGPAHLQPRSRPLLAAREFVQRCYVVAVPMRQGFSKSGGSEISGGCNVYSNGEQQAISVRRALNWLGQQNWADVSRNVVMGQSHGGLTTLAYGMDPHSGTKLLVNFAGGLRQEGCTSWEHTLIRAIGSYGEKTRLPSLWFYGTNDSFFQPFVYQGAFERYVKTGGKAELIDFGVFGGDAHAMFGSPAGLPIWRDKVLAAMEKQGLPVQVLVDLNPPLDLPKPMATGFAKVEEVDKAPLRTDQARNGYAQWLKAPEPKAIAFDPASNAFGSAWGGERPYARALANCQKNAKSTCRLYAVDQDVVWVAE
jgi:dienelactone hydrolase